MSNQNWAQNPNTPPEALAMLSTSPNANVRLLVAKNPNTPDSALWHLCEDSDPQVIQVALERTKHLNKSQKNESKPTADFSIIHGRPNHKVVDSSTISPSEVSTPENSTLQDKKSAGPIQPTSFLSWILRFFNTNLLGKS